MRFCALIFIFLLSGCNFLADNTPAQTNAKVATCEMKGFSGFPKRVTGPVVFELRTTVTIAIFNNNKTERVDMTFPKSKCK